MIGMTGGFNGPRNPMNRGISYNPGQQMSGQMGMNQPQMGMNQNRITYPSIKPPVDFSNNPAVPGQGNIGGGLTQGDIGLGLTGGNQAWNQQNPYQPSGPEFGGGMGSIMNQIRLMYPGAFGG